MADIAVVAANFKPSNRALIVKRLAAGAVARGRPVIFSATLGGYISAPANGLGGVPVEGWACADAAAGQYFPVCQSDPNLVIGALAGGGASVGAGDFVYLSATGITKTAADVVSTWAAVLLGIGTADNIINSQIVNGGVKP